MVSMMDQLQSVLESAVRRQPAGASDESLPALTVRELVTGFGLESADLWTVDGSVLECVGRSGWTDVRTSDSRSPLDELTRKRLEAAAASPSLLLVEGSEDCRSLRQTISAEAATGLMLVLELQGVQIPDGLAQSAVEILADLFRRSRLGVLRLHRAGSERLDQMLPGLYGVTSESGLGAVLAADIPAVLGCSRVCVCRRDVGAWRMESATGLEEVNERAEAVLRICRAVAEQAKLQSGTGLTEFPDGGVQWLFPLSVDGGWSESERALVVEFGPGLRPDRELMLRLLRQIRGVLRNLQSSRGVAGAGLGIPSMFRKRLTRALIAVSAASLLLTLVKVELWVGASGRLLPTQRLQIHAAESGIVTLVTVRDGEQVSAGQLLVQLRSDELSLELESVLGQAAAADARLAAIEQLKAARSADVALLSAEQAELSAGMESLRLRRQLLERRLASLEVRAEFDGRIYADDMSERMAGKPLERGQMLLELANPQGAWELQLEVPEREARHVIAAASEGALEVSFFSESAPEKSHITRLSRISESAVINDAGQLMLRVRADLAAEVLGGMQERPGAGVRAEIACGQKSLGYVLLRKFLEFVQRGGR
ncbi:MAG: HlyD family efflux transporter periplasmic adaptor subunit [Planctomycetaceae bacterium]